MEIAVHDEIEVSSIGMEGPPEEGHPQSGGVIRYSAVKPRSIPQPHPSDLRRSSRRGFGDGKHAVVARSVDWAGITQTEI